MTNRSPEELLSAMIQPTVHVAALAHSQPSEVYESQLADITNLWLHPITDDERMRRAECLGDELDFERYIVHVRRIDYLNHFIKTLEENDRP